jgi:hypothetical protein
MFQSPFLHWYTPPVTQSSAIIPFSRHSLQGLKGMGQSGPSQFRHMRAKSMHSSMNTAELELTEAELDSLTDEELLTNDDELWMSSEKLSGDAEELVVISAEELSIWAEDEIAVSTAATSLEDLISGALLLGVLS